MTAIREDQNELFRLYEKAANQVAGELPLDWTNCCIGFFVDEQERESLQVYMSCDEGKVWRDFMEDVFSSDDIMEGIFDCMETCRELYLLCKEAGDQWTGFTLLVERNGRFSAEFDYTELKDFDEACKKVWLESSLHKTIYER